MFKLIDDLGRDAEALRKPAVLKYGITYLDRATGGIRDTDLVVIGGRTGAGKSELASIIAENNCELGKNVYLFSLEAEKGEAYNRILFRNYARLLYAKSQSYTNYRDFIQNKIRDFICLNEAERIVNTKCSTLTIFQREEDFTVKDFRDYAIIASKDADIIILDHLHHFDTETTDEYAELKKTVKTLRDMCLMLQKPIILIAHFRKADRKIIQVIPDLEEFHGSSEISKEATQVITLAPYDEANSPENMYPTLIKVCKLRIDGAVSRYVGKHYFSSTNKTYTKEFTINRLIDSGKDIEELEEHQYPFWSKIMIINELTGGVDYVL